MMDLNRSRCEGPPLQAKGYAFICASTMRTWHDWGCNRSDLKDVVRTVVSAVFPQKFDKAVKDLLNQNLTLAELGLADCHEITGRGGELVDTKDMSGIAFELVKVANEGEDSKTTVGVY